MFSEYQHNLKVVLKYTFSFERVSSITFSAVTELKQLQSDQPKRILKKIGSRRALVDQKKSVFLIHLTHQTQRAEMARLNDLAKQKEEELEKQQG